MRCGLTTFWRKAIFQNYSLIAYIAAKKVGLSFASSSCICLNKYNCTSIITDITRVTHKFTEMEVSSEH